MKLDPRYTLVPPPRDGGLTDRALAALLLAVLMVGIELVALFWTILNGGFDHGWRLDARLLPLLLALGITAAAAVALIDGVRGGERGRALGYLLAVLAVPVGLAGLAALYITAAAY